MSENEEKLADQRLSEAWREASDETSPPALDRAVLGEAERAVRRESRRLSPARMRALAFAATMVLGVGLLWRMQAEIDTPPAPASLPVAAETPVAREPANADLAAGNVAKPVVPAQENDVAGDAVTLQGQEAAEAAAAFERARPSTSESAAETGRLAEMSVAKDEAPGAESRADELTAHALPDPELAQREPELRGPAESAPAGRESIGRAASSPTKTAPERQLADRSEPMVMTAAGIAPGQPPDAADADGERCTREEREQAKDWWDCIERLEGAGRYAAADREREALDEAFPDFDPPR